ncbi:very short patch repair endonuclease [Nocardioides taihuensis]|uniref:Very short patch repair endonuclease n=1 Tax=Nocardioides taihuensis TaxID=1835606 RepID=A0ABW0BKN6_9ACTN
MGETKWRNAQGFAPPSWRRSTVTQASPSVSPQALQQSEAVRLVCARPGWTTETTSAKSGAMLTSSSTSQTGAVKSRPEPHRVRPSADLSARMSVLSRRDTQPEMAIRRELYRRGLRYRLQVKVPGNNRRTIDIAFTRARLAIYIDGCFWHGCPVHHVQPKANDEWWRWKIGANRARDEDTNRLLESAGWSVIRVWEHEDPQLAATRIEAAYRELVS